MAVINIKNLTFAYPGSFDNIFENVSFSLDTDWRTGFVGRNGRGKTTFLKLLMKEFRYSGDISSGVNFEYFPYEIQNKKRDTIDVLTDVCPQAEEWEFVKETSLLGVSYDALYRPFETLSNGERTKILLAALFLNENAFLLIDEPTNHLDYSARIAVAEYLKKKRGFILVSHDRAFLDVCVDHIISVNRNSIDIQAGTFSEWWENKRLRDNYEIARNEHLKKDISRLNEAAQRAAVWSDKTERDKFGKASSGLKKDRGAVGHKAAKMMKRSKNLESRLEKAAEEKAELLKNIEINEALKLSPIGFFKKNFVEFSGVSVKYGEKTICRNISFSVNSGDRIALNGKNGCGKSSVLKLIYGENICFTGDIYKPESLIISYVPQDASNICGSISDYAQRLDIDETLFRTVLRKLGFERVQFEKDLSDYSGGQKKKVLIAGSLCQKAHLYIWDEPLNFIDVISRMQIEELILKFKPTLIFVEHDLAFCENISTKIINM